MCAFCSFGDRRPGNADRVILYARSLWRDVYDRRLWSGLSYDPTAACRAVSVARTNAARLFSSSSTRFRRTVTVPAIRSTSARRRPSTAHTLRGLAVSTAAISPTIAQLTERPRLAPDAPLVLQPQPEILSGVGT